ncbi:ataxin-7-like protein 2 [Acipenser oxyrinchus oxyrinchus]|uniref:Ataxin-7-like protein 2 n=1 Tax=Acipenser oxyrinchus oxyrinchus TaxID=40147 RepID=A0AAD8FT39_ACIOX|nr:ataxin-7-like protein 2 [Acipenser oxyrinchus oxyrinchus]
MMAVRERAAAVMAALGRRVPSLDDFAGQSWSSWIERADISASDGVDAEEFSKNGKKKAESMTLIKEDMAIFGQCPAHDDFFLVVCNHCGQVVKPQAFEKHCERRHGPLNKLHSHLHPASSPSAPPQKPRSGNPQTLHVSPKAVRERLQQGGPKPQTQPAQPEPGQKPAKGQKELCYFVPVVNLEKIPSLTQPEGACVKLGSRPDSQPAPPAPLSPSPRETLRLHGPAGRGLSESPLAERVPSRRGDATPEPCNAARSSHKTYKKISKKECDLDKHCGVLDPEKKKLCTRVLTCKIHSIHQRREVVGRTKGFDLLVAELKAGSRGRDAAGRERGVPSREAGTVRSPSWDLSPETPACVTPHCRRRLPSCTALRSRPSSGSDPEESSAPWGEADARPLYPFPTPRPNSHLSSEESEGQEEEEEAEKPDWHYSTLHPKPQGLCSFGSRSLGRGCFVFNRRLDRIRSALSSMVERHVNSHMWKKIPQAADLRSQRTSAPIPAPSSSSSSSQLSSAAGSCLPAVSPLRTSCVASSGVSKHCTAASPNPGIACRLSDSTGDRSQSIVSPIAANTPSPSSLSRTPTPGAKASRSSRTKGAPNLEHNAASRKRKKPPPASEDLTPNKKNCVLQEGGRTPIPGSSEHPTRTAPSPHRPINGAISPGNKPRPQPAPTEAPPGPVFSSGPPTPIRTPAPRPPPPKDPGSRAKAVTAKGLNCDPKGLGKKRKSRPPPPLPPAPPEPRPAKPNRTATSSDTSFFQKRKDSKGVISAGLERKLSLQKSKLHH